MSFSMNEGNTEQAVQPMDSDACAECLDPDEETYCDSDADMSMPKLGLSYLRGKRYSNTGSMTTFLAQLAGDPWQFVQSQAVTTLHEM